MEAHMLKPVEVRELISASSVERCAGVLCLLLVWTLSYVLSSSNSLRLPGARAFSKASKNVIEKPGKEADSVQQPAFMPGGLPIFGHALQFFSDRAKLAASVR